MPENLLQQSAPKRAFKDTLQFFHRIWGFIIVEVFAMGLGVIIFSAFIPENANQLISSIYQFGGAIAGLFVGLMLIFIAHLIMAPYKQRNEARSELVKETGGIAYSLEVKEVVGNWPPNVDGIGILIKLRNKFGKPLRYQVKTIAVTLDDAVLEAPNFVNNGGIIYDEMTFGLPALLFKADRKKFHNGIVSFIIDYGQPDDQARRRIDASVTIIFDGTNSTFYWTKQEEYSITLAFTDEKPSWQSILDTAENQPGVVS